MTKKVIFLIAICILVVIILIAAVLLFSEKSQPSETNPETPAITQEQIEENNKYNEALDKIRIEIVDEFNNDSLAKLENWSLYKTVTDPNSKNFGNDDACGQSIKGDADFIAFTKKADQGPMYYLELPHYFTLYYTPNYQHWSVEKFLSFSESDRRICSIAWISPLYAYPDKLVWQFNGCGGAGCGDQEDRNYYFAQMVEMYFSEKIK